jgi:hypothetical protein
VREAEVRFLPMALRFEKMFFKTPSMRKFFWDSILMGTLSAKLKFTVMVGIFNATFIVPSNPITVELVAR